MNLDTIDFDQKVKKFYLICWIYYNKDDDDSLTFFSLYIWDKFWLFCAQPVVLWHRAWGCALTGVGFEGQTRHHKRLDSRYTHKCILYCNSRISCVCDDRVETPPAGHAAAALLYFLAASLSLEFFGIICTQQTESISQLCPKPLEKRLYSTVYIILSISESCATI